jgi:hypothetical protein
MTHSDDHPDRDDALRRWRLILGEGAGDALPGLQGDDAARDQALEWLYGRERAQDAGRDLVDRQGGGRGASTLTVPAWIDAIHTLFPRDTIERLERDAVERYRIDEVVTRPEVLERVAPSESLLRAVLRTKHLMNPEVLALARGLVARVVADLLERLKPEVRASFAGLVDRRRRSPVPSARNFDFRSTLRTHLHRYDPVTAKITLERPRFFSRVRRHTERWTVILLVDQSGSMAGSVIHSAVTAACLHGVPGLIPHLVAFDTSVVDLTGELADPVETLMKVQLGGGTDIARALGYAQQLVTTPRRTLVALISDFFEGSSPTALIARARDLVQSGCVVLGLAALDPEATPVYDRDVAARLAEVGVHVGAMTPGELAAFVADCVAGRRRP